MKNLMRVSLMAATLTFAGAFAFAQDGNAPAGGGNAPAGNSAGGGMQGGPGGGMQMDPSQMQQRMQEMQERILERYKEQLKCSDEEWTAIKPLLTKVQELERASGAMGGRGMMGMMGGMRPGGGQGQGGQGGQQGQGGQGGQQGQGGQGGQQGQGGQGGPQGMPGMPGADSNDATSQLRKTLENDAASADEIKEKVKAVRDERAKSAAALKAAREELRKLLTARQEAVLITVGILD
jgi:hypothetical protein